MLKSTLILFFLLVTFFTTNSLAQLDATFDGDGKRYVQFSSSAAVRDMIVQTDHKIVMVSYCNNIGTPRPFCVIRLNEDGSFDTTWNGSGFLYAPIPGTNYDIFAQAVAQQSDGKLIVAGGGSRLVITRLNTNGTTDTTFGNGGTVQNATPTMLNRIAIQPDGKFVVVGYSGSLDSDAVQILARYLSDGTPDTSFGINGVARLEIPLARTRGESLDIQPDGKIVTGGAVSGTTTHYLLARFNRNGSLDTTFDGDGYLTVDTFTTSFREFGSFIAVKVKGDGRIVALGDRNFLYGYNVDGSRDMTFNGIGAQPAIPNSETYGMTVSASGKILVAGNQPTATNFPSIDYRSAKYLADGTPDPTYNAPDVDIESVDGALVAVFDRKGRVLLGGRSASSAHQIPWILPVMSAVRFSAPPVQNVGFAGKVINLNGKPVRNALITLKLDGNIIAYTRTNNFGNYRLNNIPTNQTYTISTIAKNLKFYDRSVMIDDATANFLLVGE